jgi:hypothetical protein
MIDQIALPSLFMVAMLPSDLRIFKSRAKPSQQLARRFYLASQIAISWIGLPPRYRMAVDYVPGK